jgi:flagellar M-ring protein FliF
VRATITVPSEYLLRVYYEQTPGADRSQPPDDTRLTQIKETETEKIQKSVTKLLPREIAEANYYPDVEVAFIQSLTPDAVEPPSLASEGLMWANANSGSLVMAGLALVSLLMLRSMVKAIPPADPNISLTSPTLAAEAKRAAQAATASSAAPASSSLGKAGPRPRLRLKKGPTLKDDLSEMVREDPDGAAAVLRSWIGNAA